MKSKKVFIIILVLMLILRLEVVFPYVQNINSNYIKLISEIECTNYERYTRIKFTLNKDKHIKEYKQILNEVFEKSQIHFNYVNKDSFEDINIINTCNIYVTCKEDKYLIVLDLYLDKENHNNFLPKAVDKINLLFKDYKQYFNIESNLKARLNLKDHIDVSKCKVEDYLKKIGYKFNSIELSNGYSIEVLVGGCKENKTYISLHQYNSGSYIIVGDPEIFISY